MGDKNPRALRRTSASRVIPAEKASPDDDRDFTVKINVKPDLDEPDDDARLRLHPIRRRRLKPLIDGPTLPSPEVRGELEAISGSASEYHSEEADEVHDHSLFNGSSSEEDDEDEDDSEISPTKRVLRGNFRGSTKYEVTMRRFARNSRRVHSTKGFLGQDLRAFADTEEELNPNHDQEHMLMEPKPHIVRGKRRRTTVGEERPTATNLGSRIKISRKDTRDLESWRKFFFRRISIQNIKKHVTEAVTERGPWRVIFRFLMTLASIAFYFAVIFGIYKTASLDTACEVWDSDKMYSTQDDQKDFFNDRVDDIMKLTGCQTWWSYFGAVFPPFAFQGIISNLYGGSLIDYEADKKRLYSLLFIDSIIYWGLHILNYNLDWQIPVLYSCWVLLLLMQGVSITAVLWHCGDDQHAKLTGFLYFLHLGQLLGYLLGVKNMLNGASQAQINVFLLLYPLALAIFDLAVIKLVRWLRFGEGCNDPQLAAHVKFMIGTSEGIRVGVLIWSYRDDNSTIFIISLVLGIIIEIIARSRLWAIVTVRVVDGVLKRFGRQESAFLHNWNRSKFAQLYVGAKYEAEYFPIFGVLLIWWFDFIPFTMPGNYSGLSRPDGQILLPSWVIIALVSAEMFTDMGTYMMARIFRKDSAIKHTEIASLWEHIGQNAYAFSMSLMQICTFAILFLEYHRQDN